jgi:signal transduction histidine kinase
VPGKNGIIAQTLREAESVVFANVSQDPELATFAALRRCRAGVCFPLQSGLDLHGVVVLATPSPRKPSPRHLELMRAFTNQAAIAFQNTRLYADLRAERDRIVDSDTQARTKLARNLHDGPAQAVSSIAMRLEFAHRLIDADPAQAKSEIDAIREAALKTSKDIRNLLFTLRPLALESNGLSAALNQLAQRLRETDRLPLTMDAGNIGPDLDITVAETVFAIIEEAITNARKHAKNSPIYVRVGQQDGTLVVLVQDQGPGFDVKEVEENYAQRGSLGLANMRERAAVIGGNLLIDSEPGRGTRITLAVPWPEKVSG